MTPNHDGARDPQHWTRDILRFERLAPERQREIEYGLAVAIGATRWRRDRFVELGGDLRDLDLGGSFGANGKRVQRQAVPRTHRCDTRYSPQG